MEHMDAVLGCTKDHRDPMPGGDAICVGGPCGIDAFLLCGWRCGVVAVRVLSAVLARQGLFTHALSTVRSDHFAARACSDGSAYNDVSQLAVAIALGLGQILNGFGLDAFLETCFHNLSESSRMCHMTGASFYRCAGTSLSVESALVRERVWATLLYNVDTYPGPFKV